MVCYSINILLDKHVMHLEIDYLWQLVSAAAAAAAACDVTKHLCSSSRRTSATAAPPPLHAAPGVITMFQHMRFNIQY